VAEVGKMLATFYKPVLVIMSTRIPLSLTSVSDV